MNTTTSITQQQLYDANRAACALLRYGLRNAVDSNLVRSAIEAVSWTISANREESMELLRTCLAPELVDTHGYEYLPAMMRFLPSIAAADDAFTIDLVTVVSEPRWSRDEPAPARGRIVRIQFNKRDLWSMSTHYLEKHFDQVMRQHPALGTRILLIVQEAYMRQRHVSEKDITYSLEFMGTTVAFTPDHSQMWASHAELNKYELWYKLSVTFREILVDVSQTDSQSAEAILLTFRDHARLAIHWNQLLLAGIQAAESLGPQLAHLLCQHPILCSFDTRRTAERLLSIAYSYFDNAARCKIEESIVALRDSEEWQEEGSNQRRHDRLLCAIPSESLVTDRARLARAEIDACGEAPTDEPSIDVGGVHFLSADESLRRDGVDLDEPANARFHEALQEVKPFCLDPNKVTTLDDVSRFLPTLKRFELLVERAAKDGVHALLYHNAEDYVFGCCEAATRAQDLWKNETVFKYVKEQLLRAAKDDRPVLREEDDDHWDNSTAGWGALLPRISAAQGMINLAREPQAIDDEMLSEVERLAFDPVPAVRHQISCDLLNLWDTARDLFWKLAEHFARHEQRIAVLHLFIDNVLLRIPSAHGERTEELIRLIHERMLPNPKAPPVRESCSLFFLRRALWEQNASGQKFVDAAIDAPLDFAPELRRAVGSCRDLLTIDEERFSEEENRRVRKWAFDLLKRSFSSVEQTLNPLFERSSHSQLSNDEQTQAQTLIGLEEQIVHEVYFASGAFDEKQGASEGTEASVADNKRKRFALEANETLAVLGNARLSSVAYTVLQTLQHLRNEQPRRMFLLVHQLVRSSASDQFQLESLASDAVVQFVEQYLAEQRVLFRDDAKLLNALMDLLDIFVQAGWPKAMLLTYRLDEAVRG